MKAKFFISPGAKQGEKEICSFIKLLAINSRSGCFYAFTISVDAEDGAVPLGKSNSTTAQKFFDQDSRFPRLDYLTDGTKLFFTRHWLSLAFPEWLYIT
jgi:hypothetical protein